MKKLVDQVAAIDSGEPDLPWDLRGREPKPMFMVVKSANPKSLENLAIFINQNAKAFVEQPIKAAITNASRDIFTGVFTSRWRPESILDYLTGNFAGYTELKPLSSPINGHTDTLLILPIDQSPAAYTTTSLASWLRHHCAPRYE